MRKVSQLNPDVVGVRGAVCEGGDRITGRISEALVRRLKKLLEV